MWIIREYAKAIIALVVLGALLWFQASYEITTLPASATQMAPTIPGNSIYLLDQSARSAKDFAYGDAAFFSFTTEKGSEVFVSRVIGVPGDKIALRDGKLFRNAQPVDETYLQEPATGIYLEEISIPRGHLFVLNDDRTSRNDSRTLGPVPWTAVYGRKKK